MITQNPAQRLGCLSISCHLQEIVLSCLDFHLYCAGMIYTDCLENWPTDGGEFISRARSRSGTSDLFHGAGWRVVVGI